MLEFLPFGTMILPGGKKDSGLNTSPGEDQNLNR
jgi:hypothetical protein